MDSSQRKDSFPVPELGTYGSSISIDKGEVQIGDNTSGLFYGEVTMQNVTMNNVSFYQVPMPRRNLKSEIGEDKFHNEGNHLRKPVQIIKIDKQEACGYTIVEEEIQRIFSNPDVAHTPIAIYSIAGAYRTGKSLMLNLFLRFLHANSKDWVASESDQLIEGFLWRGGAERHTAGIWIWDEPFFMQTQRGKVALFLMDTQGAFDHQSAVKDSSLVFGLSTLLSSLQIYNVKNQIRGDTLQHLQLFTEYAKAAKRSQAFEKKDLGASSSAESCNVQMEANNGNPFQSLLFLVRDWEDTKYNFNFEGGKELLQTILQSTSHNQEVESVRKNLRESFQNISCMLMPHPGRNVARRGEKDGSFLKICGIDGEFLECLDILVQHVFSPEQIVVKKFNNAPMTGLEFMDLALTCFSVFSEGQMPEVSTIMQGMAEAGILRCIDKCKTNYRNEMTKLFGNEYMKGDSIRRQHDQRKEAALKMYDQYSKLGDDAFIAKNRTHLGKDLDLELDVFLQLNRTNLAHLKNRVGEETQKAEEKYRELIRTKCGDKYMENCREIKDKCRKCALQFFEDNTKHFPKEIVLKYKPKLLEGLGKEAMRFEESNKQKLEILKLARTEKIISAVRVYKDKMDEHCSKGAMKSKEFETVHELAKQNASSELFSIAKGAGIKCETNTILSERIKNLEKLYKKINTANQEASSDTLVAAKNYYSSMQNTLAQGYVDQETLQKAHWQHKKQAEDSITSRTNLRRLERMIENEFEKIKDRNMELKDQLLAEFTKIKVEAYNNYREKLDEATEKILQSEKFAELHEREKRRALICYNELERKDLHQEHLSIKRDLEQQIDKYYDLVLHKYARLKDRINERAAAILKENTAGYLLYMKQLCDGKHVKPEVLEEEHTKLKNKAEDLFSAQFNADTSKIGKRYWKQCNDEMDDIYRQLKEYNARNKFLYLKKVGKFAAGTALGPVIGFVGAGALAAEQGVVGKLLSPLAAIGGGLLGVFVVGAALACGKEKFKPQMNCN